LLSTVLRRLPSPRLTAGGFLWNQVVGLGLDVLALHCTKTIIKAPRKSLTIKAQRLLSGAFTQKLVIAPSARRAFKVDIPRSCLSDSLPPDTIRALPKGIWI
jgi:hypothetical protein